MGGLRTQITVWGDESSNTPRGPETTAKTFPSSFQKTLFCMPLLSTGVLLPGDETRANRHDAVMMTMIMMTPQPPVSPMQSELERCKQILLIEKIL
jgi:hypothetical protein